MKNFFILLFVAVLTSISLGSCHREGKPKNLSEGEIFYSIEYIRNPSTFSKDLMPHEMVITFKNDKITTELKAPVGNIGISTITNPDLNIYDIYVNMMAFKFCYEGSRDNSLPGFSAMEGLRYKETGRKSVICGFNCKESLVFLKDSDKPYSIWYTDEMKVRNPNQLTPFSDVDGVLMSFFYVIGTAEMKFTADEVYIKSVPDKNFEKKKNYKVVTGGYLDTLIQKMIAF